MKRAYIRTLKGTVMVSAVLLLFGCATLPGRYVDMSRGSEVDIEAMADALRGSRVVFIGEAHDSGTDHLVQLAVIKALGEGGAKVAVALEMFPRGRQPVIDAWLFGRISEADFRDVYYDGWDMPYRYYDGIFRYAREAGLPLVAVNAERGLISAVAVDGLGRIPAAILDELKYTSCAGEPEYARAMGLSAQTEGHEERVYYLCDAQRLRDAFIAFNMARAMERLEGYTIVVLLGAAHASRTSVPSMLLRHGEVTYKVLLPDTYRALKGSPVDAGEADFIWR